MEKLVNRQEIFTGKVIHVVKDEVVLDDGSNAYREVAYHNGGVCIALKDNDGSFYVVKQYRYALKEELLEFPAGKIEKGEDKDLAIIRECIEETGYRPKNVRSLGYIIPTCGYSSEKIYLYYGEVDEFVGQNLDVDERMNVYKYSVFNLQKMVNDGIINDSKTVALLYKLSLEKLI